MTIQEQLLRDSKTIAVVGLSPDPTRPSHQVARYLQQQGYRIIPVNPAIAEVLGERCYPDIADVPEPIDLVDIFRRSELVLPVVEAAVAIGVKGIWMQDGVRNEAAAQLAGQAGIPVVMDDCTARQHRRLRREGSL